MGKKIPVCLHHFMGTGFGVVKSRPVKFDSVSDAVRHTGTPLSRSKLGNRDIYTGASIDGMWFKAHRQDRDCPHGWL